MKKYIYNITVVVVVLSLFSSCDDFLDRPQKTKANDETYWRSESDFRLYANEFYTQYFVGYSTSWGVDYAPVRGLNFCDDFTSSGAQSAMENQIPASRGSTSLSSTSDTWLTKYASGTWNFAWIRKANIMIERLEKVGINHLSEEAYNHWMGVARFFRAFEYHRLVWSFGDVPYFDRTFTEFELDIMYKDRDPRTVVMGHVYDDLKFAFEYIRDNDGAMFLNKDIAAGFITRIMLYEGTWQKYHSLSEADAKKYLTFAMEAGDHVIGTKKYAISGDFRSLFGSLDLKGHKGVLMYRHYDAATTTTHCIASYSNGRESQSPAPNLDLAKSFICNDGKPYQTSTVANAGVLDITNMIKTRDPRFEATFYDYAHNMSSTLLYACKFISREGSSWVGTLPPQYSSVTNTNDYPVMRYAEVLLNWIEAKAELQEYGLETVTQENINTSINAIRDRDLDDVAIAKGIKKTAPMVLADVMDKDKFSDPDRDNDVSPLLWEIRRERRMEFVYEHTRLADIRRWKKLDYMNNNTNSDTMLGLWIDMPKELPTYLDVAQGIIARQVMKADGTIVTFNGTNQSEMVGFYIPLNVSPRGTFGYFNYLAPIGKAQIDQYADAGYKLTQTKGWN